MSTREVERRSQHRAFFTFEDYISIEVTSADEPKKIIKGYLLSISKGGIGFAAKRHDTTHLKFSSRVIIQVKNLPAPVETIPMAEANVRYIIDINSFALVAVGCQFDKIDPQILAKIEKMVKEKSKILDKQ